MTSIVFLSLLISCQAWNAFVAIGPHKTGSTQVQTGVIANQRVLKEFGIHVIANRSAKHGAVFANTLQQANNQYFDTQQYATMIKRIQLCESDILIAAEALDRLLVEHVAELARLLSCYNTTIIAFHRSPLEHIRSFWSQYNKRTLDPAYVVDFIVRSLSAIGSGRSVGFNLKYVLSLYAKEFGPNHVKVISLEGAIAKYGSPFKAIVAVLGLPLDRFEEQAAVENSSPTVLEMDTLRHIAALGHMTGRQFRFDLRRSMSIIRARVASLPSVTMQISLPICLHDSNMELVREYSMELWEQSHSTVSLELFCVSCLSNETYFSRFQALGSELLTTASHKTAS